MSERWWNFFNLFWFLYDLFGDFVADRPPWISDSTNVGGNYNVIIKVELRSKTFMYLHWSVSESFKIQQKGFVIVSWFLDDNIWDKHVCKRMVEDPRRELASFPVKVASWQHFEMDTVHFQFLCFSNNRHASFHESTLWGLEKNMFYILLDLK